MKTLLVLTSILSSLSLSGAEPDWSRSATLPESGDRRDIYSVGSELPKLRDQGYLHAFKYPVSVTGLYIPYQPLERFMRANERNPLRRFLINLAGERVPFTDIQGMYDWLGLNP